MFNNVQFLMRAVERDNTVLPNSDDETLLEEEQTFDTRENSISE